MGMTYEQVYNMIPRVFWNAYDGYIENFNYRERSEWYRARWMTTNLINIHLPKAKQIKAQKLVKFEWEDEMKSDMMTYEDSLELIEKNRKIKNAK
jgi:hypothetical protein|tara:strand:- start:1673 stop:1957 length:285 start_codon:yes stop_codon:yes gene_type:complete